jgi:hypothetical protein
MRQSHHQLLSRVSICDKVDFISSFKLQNEERIVKYDNKK